MDVDPRGIGIERRHVVQTTRLDLSQPSRPTLFAGSDKSRTLDFGGGLKGNCRTCMRNWIWAERVAFSPGPQIEGSKRYEQKGGCAPWMIIGKEAVGLDAWSLRSDGRREPVGLLPPA